MQIRKELIEMLDEAFRTRDTQEVIYDKNKTILRKRMLNNDERQQQISIEMEVIGIMPQQFVYLFDKIRETQPQWNEYLKQIDLVNHPDQSLIDIYAT